MDHFPLIEIEHIIEQGTLFLLFKFGLNLSKKKKKTLVNKKKIFLFFFPL